MPVVTLRDLYTVELTDLFDAEQQILRELPGMAARATSTDLRRAFEDHYEQTQVHIERLELLFRQLDERPRLQPSEGMRGIVRDAHRRAAEAERGEALDAALIAAAQRIEHYEIASYGCARSYAAVLRDTEAARILQQTLDEERDSDRRLTQIAAEGINRAVGEDLVPQSTTYRSRLRYVAAADVHAFDYGHLRIITTERDDLGSIDGFIVDDRSGRPVYYVVDSGGWFSGRRYVIPVAQLALDREHQELRSELTREQLRRYPEFSASAFIAMDDEDAARYERRLLSTVLPFRRPDAMRSESQTAYNELPLYQPPGWLLESGFAAHTPAAIQAAGVRRPAPHDDRSEPEHDRDAQLRPESELMIARGEPAERAEQARRQLKDSERIERYPDR